MATATIATFRCIVLTPRSRLLDCRTPSVILPAHDGQVGIWRNHMPMIVELGLGLLEIKSAQEGDSEEPGTDRFLLVDGGFARISNNILTIMSYDVQAGAQVDLKKAQDLLEKANNAKDLSLETRNHDVRKANLLIQLAQSQQAAS